MSGIALRTWSDRTSGANRRDGKGSQLSLELLEFRCLLSTVTNLADAGPGSLRDALATTPPGGTVDFQTGLSGTITVTGATLTITQDLTIRGPGASVITVSGGSTFLAFEIAPAVTVTIVGLTVPDGHPNLLDPSGIFNSGTLAVTNCAINNDIGNGIYNAGGLTVTGSSIRGNGTDIVNDGMAMISTSILSYNTSGGIANSGTLTITTSTISDNRAPLSSVGTFTGGGMLNTGALTVIGSTLSGNSAGGVSPHGSWYSASGGGVYNTGTLVIIQSTLMDNRATAGRSAPYQTP